MPRTESKKKELTLGKSLGDLHKLSEVKQLDSNVNIITRSLNKVFQDAENLDSQGDEERAYIMYMKYFNILKQIKTKADYKNRKEYFDNLIGKRNQIKAIEQAEKLSESLKERYDLKQAEALAKKLALESSSKQHVEKEVIEKVETKPEKEPEVVESSKTSESVIKCVNLCELLRDAKTKLILMDVRPRADFLKSHISHTDCINVPEEILAPGSTVSHIQSKLPEESNAVWLQRKHADHIILLDWKSKWQDVVVRTPLRTLKDALFKYDMTTIIKSEPLILEGGYEQWLLFYPTMTTNPHVSRPSDLNQVHPPSPTMTLDFDYPDLDESLHPPAASTDVKFDTTPNNTGSLPSALVPGATSVPQFYRNLKPSQSIDSLPISNATLDNEIVPSLDNTESVSTQQRKLNGQSPTVINSSLYPSIQTEKKTFGKNTNVISDQVANSRQSVNLSFKNNLATDFSKSVVHREKKEAELKDFQHSRNNILEQDRQKIEKVEKELRDLEQMKKKEQKDVADLMRMKRKLNEELQKERQRQEEESMHLAAEEAKRLRALEQAKKEEEEKKHRLEEVERMRQGRKREEQLKELAKSQLEEEKMKKEANEKAKLIKIEEEQIKEATLAKKKEEEKEQRRAEQERIRKEEADVEILRNQFALEQQRKEVEETVRKLKEQEETARRMEEIRQREQIEEEIRQKEQMERERERQRKEAIEKIKMEEIAKEQAQKENDAAEKLNQLKVAEQQASKTVPSSTLPSGWEKRLDRATNRYFYIDHINSTTQWRPPVSEGPTADLSTTHLKDEPSVSSSRGLSRSHSSPNIKKQLEEEEERTRRQIPSIDRSIKPNVSNIVPTAKQTAYIVRKRDLNPIYGNVGPALTGLRNLGNTCYMNSTIQCLNNTSPLISYFLNDSYLNDINRESSQGMHGEVVDDFAIVVKALWSQQYRSITPRDLKNTVGKYNPMFAGYQQQDSQEFLTFLLDGLHEGLNEVKKAPDIPEQNNDNLRDEEAAPIAWKHHKLLHKSIIVELFQGQLKSTLMCRTCKKTSVTFQAFMFLSLPIPASSRCSLKECIKEFLKPELMSGSSRWKCPRCKVERDSEKKIDIWKLPPILLIGLNRFYSEGMWMQKKTTFVDFPVDDLDLSGYIIGPKPRNSYSLYGISNHYGTMEGGHYTAFCRNPVNKKWYKFDDHDVYDMSPSDVKTSAAFVLYYTSMDMPAPQYKPHL